MLRLACELSAPGTTSPSSSTTTRRSRPSATASAASLATHPDWLAADLAILMEPTSGAVEAGCQGTLRVEVTVPGTGRTRRGPGSATTRSMRPRRCWPRSRRTTRGEWSSTAASTARDSPRWHRGGVAGNVIPDACVVTVNHRFAPDRSEAEALAHVRDVLAPYELDLLDSAPGARPGLDQPLTQEFVAAVGSDPVAKYGWTDVARFAELGIPALNYGPGDPNLAHTAEERVDLVQLGAAEAVLLSFLS